MTNIDKTITLQAWTSPESSSRLGLLEFPENRHMKIATLSALSTGQLYLQEISLVLLEDEPTSGPWYGRKD